MKSRSAPSAAEFPARIWYSPFSPDSTGQGWPVPWSAVAHGWPVTWQSLKTGCSQSP